MSVYTELTTSDITTILDRYQLGTFHAFEGIAAGIENSNFFIDTKKDNSICRYVLTIFERMDASELPYFMRLMKHLAAHGLSCPDVMAQTDGSLLFEFAGKQGCIVSCLPGKTLDQLNTQQLQASGEALATLHRAGSNFPEQRANPTGMQWLDQHIAIVMEKTKQTYGVQAADLLQNELNFQHSCNWRDLPTGVIHGDMFVDNILFEGNQVSGIIDFYYAHHAAYAVDIAITLNAQALLLSDQDKTRIQAFLNGYESIRPLTPAEHNTLPQILRLTALRFWVSRLYDALFPRDGAMTQTKDPEEYRHKLLQHRTDTLQPSHHRL